MLDDETFQMLEKQKKQAILNQDDEMLASLNVNDFT